MADTPQMGGFVAVKTAGGVQMLPPSEAADLILAGEAEQASAEDIRRNYMRDDPGLAAMLGAARGATVGLSDIALSSAGLGHEAQQEYAQENPTASTLGEIGGIAGSMLLPGGGLVGQTARAGGAVGKAMLPRLPRLGKLVQAAGEGATLSGAMGAAEAVIDPEKTAADVLEQAAWGGAIGAGIGAASLGIGRLAKFARKEVAAEAEAMGPQGEFAKWAEAKQASLRLKNLERERATIAEQLEPPGMPPAKPHSVLQAEKKAMEVEHAGIVGELRDIDTLKLRAAQRKLRKLEKKGADPAAIEAERGIVERLVADKVKLQKARRESMARMQGQNKLLDDAETYERRLAAQGDADKVGALYKRGAQIHEEITAIQQQVEAAAGQKASALSAAMSKMGGSVLARIIAGSIGHAIGGPVGAAVGWVVAPKIASRVLDAVGGRAAPIAGARTLADAANGAGQFVGKVGRPLKPAAITMTAREFAELRDELQATEPGQMEAEALAAMPSNMDPGIGAKVVAQSVGRVEYLRSIMPQQQQTLGNYLQPTQEQLDSFARSIRAVIDPNSVHDDFAQGLEGKGGGVSKEAIAAAELLDGDTLARLRAVTEATLWRRKTNTLHQQQLIARYLGKPNLVEPVFAPHTALAMANIQGEQKPPPKAPGRPSKLGDRHMTNLERISTGEKA